MEGTILKSQRFRHPAQATLSKFWRLTRSNDPGKACATLRDAQHALEDVDKRTSANVGANSAWAKSVLSTSYLQAGELLDGAVMPLFQEVWRIVGNDLNTTNFNAKVDQVAEFFFAAYSYQGKATGSKVSEAATTYVDGEHGKLFVCTVILCKQAAPYQQHRCLQVHASCCGSCVFEIAANFDRQDFQRHFSCGIATYFPHCACNVWKLHSAACA